MLINFILILMLLFAAVLTVLSASIVLGMVMARGVPFVSLPQADWRLMCELAEVKPGQIVYDVGCGKANLLVVAAKEFGAKGIGYELSLWPYLWAKCRIWRSGADVEIRMKNFFGADLSQADVVFCYLFPEIMAKLAPKFKSELKPGAVVVSYAFPLPEEVIPAQAVRATPKFGSLTGKPAHTSMVYVYWF